LANRFQERFAEAGYTTIVVTTGFDNRNIHDSVQTMLDRGAEAILLVGAVEDPRVKDIIAETNVPFVTTYTWPNDVSVPAVGFDNGHATEMATRHLLDLGHRHFAMIAGLTDGNDRQRDRVAAYRRCVAGAGAVGADRVIHHSFDMAAGSHAMAHILEHYPDTTAVICNTDVFAIGAIAECRNRGLKVPDDLSVIGFDDAEYAALLDPPLTTVTVPAAAMGLAAAEALLCALRDKARPQPLRLETHLSLRASTAPPRNLL
jgi:LacI family transcriptional regulator